MLVGQHNGGIPGGWILQNETNVACVCFQVISEERDNVVDEAATWSRDIPAEILNKIEGGREVSSERVTVWIDPLDATQEYTGAQLHICEVAYCSSYISK